MAGQMKLDPDWKEFIELLNASVDYNLRCRVP